MGTKATDNTKAKSAEVSLEVEETEEYPLNYIVNISNCENCTINIHQEGKPSGGTPPPGGS